MTTNVLESLLTPGVNWAESDYATLRLRLDLFDDYILARRFEGGLPGALFMVDPLDVAARLADLNLGTGLLPRDCLFWHRRNGAERLAIAIAPAVWRVSMAGEKLTWQVPLPWLILAGCGQAYQLYATRERPEKGETRLYHAPVPNMSGNVCRGNVPFPVASAGTMWQAWDAFINSGFNRDLSTNKSREYPNDITEQWRYLHLSAAAEYPLDDLLEYNRTLKNLVEGTL